MRTLCLLTLMAMPLSQAHAGLISSLDPLERLFLSCEAQLRSTDDTHAEHARVWKECVEQAKTEGLDDVLPDLRGRWLMAQAWADAETKGLKANDQFEFVFRAIAVEEDARFPYPTMASSMRTYLLTQEGRSRFGPYRDVTLRWLPNDSLRSAGKEHVNAILRRHVEDATFRWAAHGSTAGAEADVIVQCQFHKQDLAPIGDEFRPVVRVEYRIAVSKVTINARSKTVPGFEARAVGHGATEEAAKEDALQEVAQQAAAALLHRVIQEAFRPRDLSR